MTREPVSTFNSNFKIYIIILWFQIIVILKAVKIISSSINTPLAQNAYFILEKKEITSTQNLIN